MTPVAITFKLWKCYKDSILNFGIPYEPNLPHDFPIFGAIAYKYGPTTLYRRHCDLWASLPVPWLCFLYFIHQNWVLEQVLQYCAHRAYVLPFTSHFGQRRHCR